MPKQEQKLPTGITGWMVRTFVTDYTNIKNKDVRAGYGYVGGWVSCIVNLILAIIKLLIGFSINSKALIADALHSASDMLSSAIVIFGFKMAKKPRDKEHPFGHANAELIAALIMSVLLIVAGFEILKYNAMLLWEGQEAKVDVGIFSIVLVCLTIVIKEWLFAVSTSLSQAIGSTALSADAWHHRLDSLSTGLVVVSLVANYYGYYWLDPAIGVLVGGFVIYAGVELAQDSISPLLGEMVDQETLDEIRRVCLAEEHTGNVHDIVIHKYGVHHFISLHLEILDQLSPIEMHDIAAGISEELAEKFNGECNIHVDPVEYDSDRYRAVATILHEAIEKFDVLLDFHDLQFRDTTQIPDIHWEFSVDPHVCEDEYEALHKTVQEWTKPRLEGLSTHFSLEPGYAVHH